jgi:hypothetical protein
MVVNIGKVLTGDWGYVADDAESGDSLRIPLTIAGL